MKTNVGADGFTDGCQTNNSATKPGNCDLFERIGPARPESEFQRANKVLSLDDDGCDTDYDKDPQNPGHNPLSHPSSRFVLDLSIACLSHKRLWVHLDHI